MFYGRKDQIARFSALWSKSVPSLVVCRGRRRIGKSTLIREFARQSGGLYLKIEGLAPDGYMTNAKQGRPRPAAGHAGRPRRVVRDRRRAALP